MSRCSLEGCERNAYSNYSECILHCDKSNLNFFKIRHVFYEALDSYAIKNTKNEQCYFGKISFPKPDDQSDINYVKILRNIPKIQFGSCSFYTDSFELGGSKVFFYECEFKVGWTLINYNILDNHNKVIYQLCVFYNEVVSEIPNINKYTEYTNHQFDYTCIFHGKIIFIRASLQVSPFNENQGEYIANSFSKIILEECQFYIFEMYISCQENGEIEFRNCRVENKLKIRSVESGEYREQQENKSKLKSVKIIDCSANNNTYFRVGYLEIDEFILSNLRNPGGSELNIGDCFFNKVRISNFRNLGKFKLFKINFMKKEKGCLFQIDNTSIGDTDFQSISLVSFEKVYMFDNIFSDIKYTNVEWKENINVGEYADDEIRKIAKERDTYRTLKNVAHKNNDKPQELTFFANEMKRHKELTIKNRCKDTAFPRFHIKDCVFCKGSKNLREGRISDIAILLFSEISNNYGLNWVKPLMLIVVLSLCFYLVLLGSMDGFSMNNLSYFAKYIFVFINPAHKLEFVCSGKWTFLTYAVDFIFRLAEGLLIYQTITAFRKYTRK